MTDKKISELTNITGANVDDANDELAIVDASATETKAITRAELFSSVASASFTGAVTIDLSNLNSSGDLPVADGGTGASTASGARTALGLAIGSDVQAWDADLDTYAANPLTAAELGELQNIGTTTITDTQWGYLGAMDQGVATADSPEFAGLTVDTDTLFVDASADSVGINNVSPSASLDVTGDVAISSDLTVDTDTLYVDSVNDRVGIGTSSPDYALDVAGTVIGEAAINLLDNRDGGGPVRIDGVRASNTPGDTAGAMRFYVSDNSNPTGTEAMRIDSSGNVGIGTSSPSYDLEVSNVSPTLAIASANNADGKILFTEDGNPEFSIRMDGTSGVQQSLIFFRDRNDTEAMRVDSSGHLLVGKTDTTSGPGAELRADGLILATRDGNQALLVDRETNDGTLVTLRQDNTEEGSISVSGTTVSYNGGHLSRWSRLPDGTDDTHIYKGTVMTNLDEMVEWRDEEGDLEDNEQLNKTTVSSEEGDPNVAGLFVAWDHDDDWGDYYLAMTGDLVVRIAQGVTVQRGDLLMSAGDGTAKPQGDDIVRSKTVAKVTSTHVSHTYPDGSYAVPCVVMAC